MEGNPLSYRAELLGICKNHVGPHWRCLRTAAARDARARWRQPLQRSQSNRQAYARPALASGARPQQNALWLFSGLHLHSNLHPLDSNQTVKPSNLTCTDIVRAAWPQHDSPHRTCNSAKRTASATFPAVPPAQSPHCGHWLKPKTVQAQPHQPQRQSTTVSTLAMLLSAHARAQRVVRAGRRVV